MVSISAATTAGKHVTYPWDGWVHETRPGISRQFREAHPDLSNVTFRIFDHITVSPTGPPPGAKVGTPAAGAFAVDAPLEGPARAFAAVTNTTDVAKVESYPGGEHVRGHLPDR